MARRAAQSTGSLFELYISEINRYPLLTAEEEAELARRYRERGDVRMGHRLVLSNLRFVVKVAYEYRSYGIRISDLVQEGNIGLMRAIQKFDPEKEIRLISYAVWWIRAYIQNYILRSWSLVKMGTTQAQRKLFFSLARTRRELDRLDAGKAPGGEGGNDGRIASRLHVKVGEVREMSLRMDRRDLSLDAPLGEDGTHTHVELVESPGPSQDEALGAAQEHRVLAGHIAAALAQLDERERFIIERRVMTDTPLSLKDLGEHFGFSRERARQLELRAKSKLRGQLDAVALELDWPTGGPPPELDEAAA